MAAEWNKSMSTEATLMELVTAEIMAEATIGGWRTLDGESYPDPRPGEIVVFEDFY
jgi:formylmethanofuran:tetrahydromethanopterin formyltransferase